jgi:hypothetical protein
MCMIMNNLPKDLVSCKDTDTLTCSDGSVGAVEFET